MPQSRNAFTLVEMLVSVALVLLMMMMFARVFGEASKSMTQQKGMAENDQKARTLTILLQGDLKSRTMKDVRPFAPSPPVDSVIGDRVGFVYISENATDNDLDDILHLTIKVRDNELPFAGRATLLGTTADLNQPEADDGQLTVNGAGATVISTDAGGITNRTGTSRNAEVVWFVRNGTLYRRVLLIRERYYHDGDPSVNTLDSSFHQPERTSAGAPFFNPFPSSYNGFWRDFDYSARLTASTIEFNDVTRLSNAENNGFFALSNPKVRFGFDLVTGRPREYGNPSTGAHYIGRFTHRETSDPSFGYPGQLLFDENMPAGNDSSEMSPQVALQIDGDGVVLNPTTGEAYNGERRGEDAMLHHVHAFDIKVWDDGLNQFVDLGHTTTGGLYHMNERQNVNFGPSVAASNRVYDTWNQEVDLNGDLVYELPPFEPRPYRLLPVARRLDEWQNAADYSLNQVVWRQGGSQHDNLVFEMTNGSGTSGGGEPAWPSNVGDTVTHNGTQWTARDNKVLPLKAIQITIRYYDVSSDQMRQLTISQSLLPPFNVD